MKRVLLFSLLIFSTPVLGAAPEELPPGTPGGTPSAVDYLSNKTVPLSPKEQKALQLSNQWARTDIPPVLAGGGKIMYVHGAVLPSIIASPMQVCDVELQPGEKINEIIVGDSARWLIESGTSGVGTKETVHLFIKPVDVGLESTAIVTTDRRVYHLRLLSQLKGHTPYVGFSYSDELRNTYSMKKKEDERREHWSSTTTTAGDRIDLAKLNFNYTLSGDRVSWRPERVYDDGQQTFIRLPDSRVGEMPVLLVRKGGSDVLVNYRVQDSTMTVDGLFDRIALVVGVGRTQEKVEVRRDK